MSRLDTLTDADLERITDLLLSAIRMMGNALEGLPGGGPVREAVHDARGVTDEARELLLDDTP